MTDFKRSSAAPAADPAARFANRNTSTASRISALVADAGLGCKFQSIVSSEGQPFAEMAVVFAPDGERLHDERTIRLAAGPTEFARGAAAFRLRAAVEFAEAPGLNPGVHLFLPHYCVTPEVERFGPPLAEVLASSRLSPARVIVEMLAAGPDALADLVARVGELRSAGVFVAMRTDAPDDRARAALRACAPDFFHFVQPPRSMDEIELMRSFVDEAGLAHTRVIIGGVAGSDDYASASGGPRAVSLFYGEAIAGPRFLC
jgi:hypothetical protein